MNRYYVWVVAGLIASGCAGDGCTCMGDIPGGFPVNERVTNTVQVRVTPSGLAAIADNSAALVDALFEDGLSFPVPRDCSADRKVCCYVPDGYCELAFDMDERPGDLPRIEINPTGANSAELILRARVYTPRAMPVHQPGLFGDVECSLSMSTTWSGTPHATIVADLHFAQDPVTGTTRVEVDGAQVYNITAGDFDIGGGFLCTTFGDPQDAVDSMVPQFSARIPGAVDDFVCAKCDTDADCGFGSSCSSGGQCILAGEPGDRCVHSIGREGRFDLAALLGGLLTPNHDKDLDVYLALGGYANTASDGLSLGVLTGAIPGATSVGDPCVPAVAAPAVPAIAQTPTLVAGTQPHTGEPFDLGIGVHRAFLDRALWAAHQSGALCLDLGAARVPLLNTGALSILAPSMIDLVHGVDAPLFLSIRPQLPPTLALGEGTFTPTGELDEPLLTLQMQELEIDFWALIDQRYVRLLTLRASLAAEVGLTINERGNIQLVLGDLADALTDLRVTHSELLQETPDELVARFPAVLSVALPMLGDNLGDGEGIEVPAFAGMTLEMTDDSLTSFDGGAFLGVFGDLVPAAASATARRAHVTTEARIVAQHVPPTRAFQATPLPRAERPNVTLELGGTGAAELEWQLRFDGGFWTPYTRERTVTVSREQFWLQGRHTVEVRARAVGQPRTADPEPVVLDFLIDTVAPAVALQRADDGYLIEATDLVTEPGALRVRARFDGGAWQELGGAPVMLAVPAGAELLEVEVVDEAGNTAGAAGHIVGFHGRGGGGGCDDCSAGGGGAGAGGVLVLAIALLGLLPRRGRWALAVAALTLAAACSGNVGGGDDDGGGDDEPPDPTVVHPGPTGRWGDIAADGNRVVVSAYEETYGDLVVSDVGADGALDFDPVAGAPDAPVVLDPAGYRGGVVEPGDDVGAWTSVALRDGRALVAYQDRGAGALLLAVETGDRAWQSHVIDPGSAGAPAGLYADLALGPDGVPAVAYMTHAIPTMEGGFTAELRWAQAAGPTPAASTDWTITTLDSVAIPCTGLCDEDGGYACAAETLTCRKTDDTCADPCTGDTECVEGACIDVLPTPAGMDLPEGIGLFASAGYLPDGRAVVAYYDRVGGDLYLQVADEAGWARVGLAVAADRDRGQWSSLAVATDGTVWVAYQDAMDDTLRIVSWNDGELGAARVIDDGRRDGDRPHPVGADASLLATGDGLFVAYQDATTADLLYATSPDGVTWTRGDLLTGVHGYGFFAAAAAAGDAVWVSSYVYDRSVFPPGETQVVKAR